MAESPEPLRVSGGTAEGATDWLRAFSYTTGGQVVQGVARLACLVILGRLAGKESLGQVSAVLAIGTLLVLCWPQAAGAGVARFTSMALAKADSSRARSIQSFTATTVAIASIPLGILCGLSARFLVHTDWVVAVSACFFPAALGSANFVRGVRNGQLRFRRAFCWDSTGAAVTVLAMAGVALSGDYVYFVSVLCLGYLVSAFADWPPLSWRRRPQPTEERRALLGFIGWTSVQVVAAGGLLHVATTLAAWHGTAAQLGEFGAAVSIATPFLLLSIALRTSSAPFLARQVARGQHEALRRATDSLMRIMVGFLLPIFGAICILAGPILEILFGSDFGGASGVLVIVVLGVSVNCYGAPHTWLSVGPDWGPRGLAACNGAGFAVGSITAGVCATFASTTGIAFGYLAGSIVSFGAAMLLVWRRARMEWWGLASRLVTGYGLIGLALAVSDQNDLTNQVAIAACFILLLAMMNSRDLRRALSEPALRQLRGS